VPSQPKQTAQSPQRPRFQCSQQIPAPEQPQPPSICSIFSTFKLFIKFYLFFPESVWRGCFNLPAGLGIKTFKTTNQGKPNNFDNNFKKKNTLRQNACFEK
jgi:hypothetical protein